MKDFLAKCSKKSSLYPTVPRGTPGYVPHCTPGYTGGHGFCRNSVLRGAKCTDPPVPRGTPGVCTPLYPGVQWGTKFGGRFWPTLEGAPRCTPGYTGGLYPVVPRGTVGYAPRCTPGYTGVHGFGMVVPPVPRGRRGVYPTVPRGTYPTVPRGTAGYTVWGCCTPVYPGVPRSTVGYSTPLYPGGQWGTGWIFWEHFAKQRNFSITKIVSSFSNFSSKLENSQILDL